MDEREEQKAQEKGMALSHLRGIERCVCVRVCACQMSVWCVGGDSRGIERDSLCIERTLREIALLIIGLRGYKRK